MDNLFQQKYVKNWQRFFQNDPELMTHALLVCKTGIVKLDHNLVQKDCTGEELWQRITNEQKGKNK